MAVFAEGSGEAGGGAPGEGPATTPTRVFSEESLSYNYSDGLKVCPICTSHS